MNHEKGRALSQITLDDDYNIPDYKPDLVKVMKDKGEIKFEEIKETDGHVLVKGMLLFHILYRSDQEDKKLDMLEGSISFQENISMEGIEELDPVNMKAEIEDLSIGIINSRKLSIRALVMLEAVVKSVREEEVIIDAEEDDNNIEMLKENKDFLQLVSCKKDNFRLKQEIVLPSNKPNIHHILWKNVQIRGLETRLQSGKMELSGEVLLYILYHSEEDENQLQWMETAIPLHGEINCGDCEDDMVYKVTATPMNVEIEAKPDYDGEERMLNLDMTLDLYICLWKEEKIEIVEDIYSLNKNIIPAYEETVMQKLIAKNYAKSRVNDRIQLSKEQENILQICSCEGNVIIDTSEIKNQGVQVAGTLEIELMYITTDDAMPIGTVKGYLPFEQFIEVPEISETSEFELEAGIEQLSAVLLDNTQVEIKGTINLNLIAFENQKFKKLKDIDVCEQNMEELQKRPGIIGYIVKEGDRLWTIAKENHTTIADLAEMNQLNTEEIKRGDKLLIVKTV